MPTRWISILLALTLSLTAAPDSTAVTADAGAAALERLSVELDELAASRDELEARLRQAPPDERDAIHAELEAVRSRAENLRSSFEHIATGVQPDALEEDLSAEPTLEEQARKLLAPLVSEFHEMTKKSRRLDHLRLELSEHEENLALALDAVERLDERLDAIDAPELRRELRTLRMRWQSRADELKNDLELIELQLADAETDDKGFFATLQASTGRFLQTRGIHLLAALGAAGLTFFLLRLMYRLLVALIPRGFRRRQTPFVSRLTFVGFHLFCVVGSALVFVGVLTMFGDWLLVSLFTLFAIALAWSARNKLVDAWTQVTILLNLGSIREGERVEVKGVPWLVARIGFRVRLTNPALGYTLRLPLREVLDTVSRSYSSDERWFPTRKGDWVVLADGTFGQVECQSHESVRLQVLGSAVTWPTGDFLAARPKNLSGGFTVVTTFGVGYGHQADIDGLPEILHERLLERLADEEYSSSLRGLTVRLASAGASSLDLKILLQVKGDAAPHYVRLEHDLQHFSIAAANAEGWDIPFPQLTLHQATPAAPREEADARSDVRRKRARRTRRRTTQRMATPALQER